MNRMTLEDYAKIHGQAKAAKDFGVIQCAISKAIRTGRQIFVTVQSDGTVN
ncbi:Cro/CI family transcriptional regulator [Pantoea vagans]|uniref:Cro/CI family transcriptional regulator n=1 Tax=Pantoea vagans TaxID=470934 RepID=UPI0028A95171|nr:Cro/CI family transcriptional regulator [Pantoea vagans]